VSWHSRYWYRAFVRQRRGKEGKAKGGLVHLHPEREEETGTFGKHKPRKNVCCCGGGSDVITWGFPAGWEKLQKKTKVLRRLPEGEKRECPCPRKTGIFRARGPTRSTTSEEPCLVREKTRKEADEETQPDSPGERK